MNHPELYEPEFEVGDVFEDRLLNSKVTVVGVYSDCVFLRYPDQEEITLYRHTLCDTLLRGTDEVQSHLRECEKHTGDYPQTVSDIKDHPLLSIVNRPRDHKESDKYKYPLDGKRFEKVHN
jgi:hypothetical protein